MNIKKLLLVPALIMLLSPIMASAQSVEVPHYINFQSVLRDDSGNLIEDGPVDLTIKVLDQDGTEIYVEQQPGVQVVRSSVNVMIGEGIVPGSSPSAPTGGVPLTAVDPASGTKRLQIQFGSNLPSEPMELTSVPYAMYAEKALGLVADIAEDQIPATFVTETELATAINQEKTDRTTAETGIQTTVTTLQTDLTTEVNARTNADTNLQNAINAEVVARGAADTAEATARGGADTALQTNINTAQTTANTAVTNAATAQTTANTAVANAATAQATADGKVSKGGDSMTGPLTMSGGNILMSGAETVDGVDVSALGARVYGPAASDPLNHEDRLAALEGAPAEPATKLLTLRWVTNLDNASGGRLTGTDATGWSLSGVNTADGKWVSITRSSITVPSGCIPMATGTVSPNVSDGEISAHDYDDPAFLKITYSGAGQRTLNFRAYGLGNDGEYDINIRIVAVPTSAATDCTIP